MLTSEMARAIALGEWRRANLTLTVLHDERCPLCRRLHGWLARQATVAPIEFVAAGSPEARARFPQLDHERSSRVLTVVASDGAVYEGERAWLVCAWSLSAWQPVAEHFGRPDRLWLVRIGARVVDGYRHRHGRGAACGACPIAAPGDNGSMGRPW